MTHIIATRSFKLLAAFIIALPTTICNGSYAEDNTHAYRVITNSRIESALAGRSDLSMFHQALVNSGVATELNDLTEYTMFAPTNAAMAEIQQREYPCFYSVDCRSEIAAMLRNHIIPHNYSLPFLVTLGVDIPTLGTDKLNMEETYKGQYAVNGHSVRYESRSNTVSVYAIDGVITNPQELSQFRRQPMADTDQTITTTTVRSTTTRVK